LWPWRSRPAATPEAAPRRRRRWPFRSPWFYLGAIVLLGIGYWVFRPRSDGTSLETCRRAVAGPGAGTSSSADQAQTRQQLQEWAQKAMVEIEKNIHDYSAVLVKRERSGGELGPEQAMFVKVRQHPFSVYIYFLSPESRKGEEAIYVTGRNDGKILGHATGLMGKIVGLYGTVRLDPNGTIAMYGQRHSITDMGILSLTRLLLERARKYANSPACFVRYLPDAKINDRPCTCIEAEIPLATAEHPRGRALARVFVDQELDVPVRYEQYDWSGEAGDAPQLTEQYTYLDLKVNNGFTDADFDVRNPNYEFP
jgi:hypothetical protein